MRFVNVTGGQLFSRYHGHDVHVENFEIGEFPVTVEEFGRFVAETGYRTAAERKGWTFMFKDGKWDKVPGASWRSLAERQTPQDPVVIVSRDDTEAYCAWAGCRLPTPAEWELAASGGTERRYPWGNEPSPETWCLCGQTAFKTRPRSEVPAESRSPFGCLDMLGNVWEWTSGPSMTHANCGVFMGGGWWDPAGTLTTWYSHTDDPPDFCVDDVGFRVVRSLEKKHSV